MNNYQHEWAIIHSDIERYEQFSLIIKLFSVFISTLSVAYSINAFWAVCLILTLWLQDGIWKTFQKRLEARIGFIEEKMHSEHNKDNESFQLYSQWEGNRLGTAHLIKEYLFNAIKPTVAYPYLILVVLFCFSLLT